MKCSGKFLILSVLAGTFLLPSPSFSDVKVLLKNGRTVTAEICQDEGDRLLCSKSGGTFEIEKKEIRNVRETAKVRHDAGDNKSPERAETPKEPSDVKAKAGNTGQPVTSLSGAEKMSPADSLEQITTRKKDLIKERETLLNDKERLQKDIQSAPDWMPDKQFYELKKKADEIDGRVNRFNEEIRGLNEEESKVRDKLKDRKE